MTKDRRCIECLKPLPAGYAGRYCNVACRSSFHNRRTKRGALVYDVMMIGRFLPGAGARGNFMARLEQQMDAWREEDVAAGRPTSWSRPLEVGYDLPLLYERLSARQAQQGGDEAPGAIAKQSEHGTAGNAGKPE